jgi:hypothetical protein
MIWHKVEDGMPPTGKCTDCLADCGGCDSVLVHYAEGIINAGSRYQPCATAYLNGPHYQPGQITHWAYIDPAPDHGL